MIKVKKIFIIACFLVGASVQANAGLTLEECRRLAGENYPLIKKYQLINQTTDYTVANIGKGYLPQLSFSGQASYQSDVARFPDALTGIMSSYGYNYKGLTKDQYKLAVDMNQVVWDGGEISAQKKVSGLQGEVQVAQTDVDMYAIRERIDNLFFGILLIEENIRLNAELQNLLLSNCRKIEVQQENGVAMKADADAVKAEYLKAKQQEVELKSGKESYARVLALFIGKEESYASGLEMPKADMPASLENARPEMNLFDMRIRHAEAKAKLVDAGVMPRLSLFAQGSYGYPSYDMFDDMFDRNLKLNGIVGVRLSWNIGKFYTKKNEKRKTALSINDAEADREVFLFNSKLQSTQEQSDIEKFRKMITDDDEIISLRESVRKAAEAKLDNGIIDSDNLLQEITRENQARIGKVSHEIEMLKKIYELRNTVNQ